MSVVVSAIFRIRRDTAANWTSANPVLKLGEPGLETDTRKVKYGDGSTAWSSLAYSAAGAIAWADITSKPANLTAIAAQTTAADKLTYWTGLGTVALADLTTFGRSLIDDADATAARTTLGLGALATQGTGSLPNLGIGAAPVSTYGLNIANGTALGLRIVTTGGNMSSPTINAADGSVSIVAGASNSLGYGYFATFSAHDVVLARNLTERLRLTANGVTIAGSARLPSYTVASAPSASTHGAGAMIYVSNESGGAVPAFSDGSSWRRVTDRAVIS